MIDYVQQPALPQIDDERGNVIGIAVPPARRTSHCDRYGRAGRTAYPVMFRGPLQIHVGPKTITRKNVEVVWRVAN